MLGFRGVIEVVIFVKACEGGAMRRMDKNAADYSRMKQGPNSHGLAFDLIFKLSRQAGNRQLSAGLVINHFVAQQMRFKAD